MQKEPCRAIFPSFSGHHGRMARQGVRIIHFDAFVAVVLFCFSSSGLFGRGGDVVATGENGEE